MTEKTPRISIITACFRSEKTIRDTLESVNFQTYQNIEHIIVDGASNDRTMELVHEHGKRVTQAVSEKDRGIFDAYNKGLKLAGGEVIGFLNSDDFYATPRAIEVVMRAFRDASVEAVYADLVYVDKDDTSKIVRYWKSRAYSHGDFCRAFVPAHPTLFLRKSVYDRAGEFNPEYRFAGDFEFMLRAFHSCGVKSVYVPEILVRMRTGGATGGSMAFIRKQNLEIMKAFRSQGVEIFKPTYFLRKLSDRLLQRLRVPFVRMPESAK